MTTRSILLADIQAWTGRNDDAFAQALPTMLRMVEARVRRDIRVAAQEKTVTLTVTSRRTALPPDFLTARAITLANASYRVLDFRSPEKIRESAYWENGASGQGTLITIEGTDLVMVPPATSETVDLVYYAAFPALLDANDTNWILTNHYDIYFDLMMIQVGKFSKDRQTILEYEAMYAEKVEMLSDNETEYSYRGSTTTQAGAPHGVV